MNTSKLDYTREQLDNRKFLNGPVLEGQSGKILIIGDYTKCRYHQLPNFDLPVLDLLKERYEVLCTEDYDELTADNIKAYRAVLAYTDCWGRELEERQVYGLLEYVRNGGGLLAVHSGISLQTSPALAELLGARLSGHPPYGIMDMKPAAAAADHPIMEGITAFTVTDEPYQFNFSPSFNSTILLEYDYDGRTWPAAWTHQFGQGHVVYLMNGHDGGPFFHPVYRDLISNTVEYIATQA